MSTDTTGTSVEIDFDNAVIDLTVDGVTVAIAFADAPTLAGALLGTAEAHAIAVSEGAEECSEWLYGMRERFDAERRQPLVLVFDGESDESITELQTLLNFTELAPRHVGGTVLRTR